MIEYHSEYSKIYNDVSGYCERDVSYSSSFTLEPHVYWLIEVKDLTWPFMDEKLMKTLISKQFACERTANSTEEGVF